MYYIKYFIIRLLHIICASACVGICVFAHYAEKFNNSIYIPFSLIWPLLESKGYYMILVWTSYYYSLEKYSSRVEC
jgi:hypothetical protein